MFTILCLKLQAPKPGSNYLILLTAASIVGLSIERKVLIMKIHWQKSDVPYDYYNGTTETRFSAHIGRSSEPGQFLWTIVHADFRHVLLGGSSTTVEDAMHQAEQWILNNIKTSKPAEIEDSTINRYVLPIDSDYLSLQGVPLLVGDKTAFAIEWSLLPEHYTLGQFCFWIHHQMIGDWEDTAHLVGCSRWIEKFINNPKDYFASDLIDTPKEYVISMIFDAYINNLPSSQYPLGNPHRELYIKHLGMSSFERFDIVYLHDNHNQRIIWRSYTDMIVKEAIFPYGTIQSVMQLFVDQYTALQP